MAVQVGSGVWLPCEVKPGPFSNERLARIQIPTGEWVGFVDVEYLQDKEMKEGETFVLARVTDIKNDSVIVLVQGHALDSRYMQLPRTMVQPLVPLSA